VSILIDEFPAVDAQFKSSFSLSTQVLFFNSFMGRKVEFEEYSNLFGKSFA